MAEKELAVQTKVINRLTKDGAWVMKTVASNRSGTPDVLACWKGKFVAVEVKTETGRLSRLQEYQLQQIAAAGGLAIVCYGYDDFVAKWEAKVNTVGVPRAQPDDSLRL